MKLKNLFYIVLIISFLSACKEESKVETTTTEEAKEEQVIEGVKATPVKKEDKAATTSSTGAPSYMDIELKGYGVPDANVQDFHGKVVFVNHWGSWCPPCRMEMPSIQSLYDDYGDKVEFVMIAMEKRQGAHVPYIEKEGYTFPVYTALSPIVTEMKPRAFPTTIILDKQGQIRISDVGAKDWNAPQVRELLDELLAQ
ncbi:TlpA family protein disulfide reductase [Weeksellaceae bacterium KMM 9713]|uniref:TlpA family protein disulfide reductase n=1 Tax=Profundicola chukchiensis TaxID=2961959 RepID=A0A9X4N037_9FLAO|nr:TlpA disulfide reductase family protein [Profundicola chukchiensis]MDG4946175.1 TlpA family protein disulfide reductase [Profundicola chukchiensis]